MDEKRIQLLLNAYQQHTASEEERAEFAVLLHNENFEPLFSELFDQSWDDIKAEDVEQTLFPNADRILQDIKKQPQQKISKSFWRFPATIAASAIVLVSVAGLYYYNSVKPTSAQIVMDADVAPGKDGATLTLANGKKIRITDVLAGNVTSEAGVKITKTESGQLVYEVVDNKINVGTHTLSTSRAEQMQVRLQDGTVVFINAASSLSYPTSFANSNKREVSLQGEAYFEVAKDAKHPFVIVAGQQKTEVLGTTFNINSYADEPAIKTTLLEGSVKVVDNESGAELILKPGEQAMLVAQGLSTKNVQVGDEVAWKSGYFMFNNETLADIMKDVSRWYNVEVRYEDENIKRKTFFGSVSRSDKVSEVLKLLQKTGGAKFEIKGKQIIVSQDH